jgi:excisionase family DNA binding protein
VAVTAATRSSHTSAPIAIQARERYLSRAQMAELMGVSLATLDRMVAGGMPSVTWGRRTRRFRPSAAIAWAELRSRR